MPYFTYNGEEISFDDILQQLVSVSPELAEKLKFEKMDNDFDLERFAIGRAQKEILQDGGEKTSMVPSKLQEIINEHIGELLAEINKIQKEKEEELKKHPLPPDPVMPQEPIKPDPPEKIIHRESYVDDQEFVIYPSETYENPYYKEQLKEYNEKMEKYENKLLKHPEEIAKYNRLRDQKMAVVLTRKEIVTSFNDRMQPLKDRIEKLNQVYIMLEPGHLTQYNWGRVAQSIADELTRSNTDRGDYVNAIIKQVGDICSQQGKSDSDKTEELITFLQAAYVWAKAVNSQLHVQITNSLNILSGNRGDVSLIPKQNQETSKSIFNKGLHLFERSVGKVQRTMQEKNIIKEKNPEECLKKIFEKYNKESGKYTVGTSYIPIGEEFKMEGKKVLSKTI